MDSVFGMGGGEAGSPRPLYSLQRCQNHEKLPLFFRIRYKLHVCFRVACLQGVTLATAWQLRSQSKFASTCRPATNPSLGCLMFGIFAKSSKQDFVSQMRRLIELTKSSKWHDDDLRISKRWKRTLPVFYAPWFGAPIKADEVKSGICIDLSETGMKLLLVDPPRDAKYMVSFPTIERERLEYLTFVIEKRHAKRIVPGIFSIGGAINSFVDPSMLGKEHLKGLSQQLSGSELLTSQLKTVPSTVG